MMMSTSKVEEENSEEYGEDTFEYQNPMEPPSFEEWRSRRMNQSGMPTED
jgi:hypothetical protein